jgi:S1-C subfamily serine protease
MTQEMEPEDVYEQNCHGVVEIITEAGRASGFLISQKGLVLTNAHAVLNGSGTPCSQIFVKHGNTRIPSHLIALGDTDSSNPNNVDLALLRMERVPADAIALTLGQSSKVKIGQHVYYIGNSKGEGLCMTAGIVSDKNRKVGERYFIMTDAATNPGNSGGSLFNAAGEVISVHVSARLEAVGMKYAIPMDTARLFLNTVEDQLKIPHDTLADHLVVDQASTESVSAGVILTLVLSGISLIVKNIEFIQDIVETITG